VTPPTKNPFGQAVREARRRAGKTLADVGSYLGLSIPYLSEVERGTRAPLAPEKISLLASFLGADFRTLLQAAAVSGKVIRLDPTLSPAHQQAAAALARGWDVLTPEDLEKILAIVRPRIPTTQPEARPQETGSAASRGAP
jgi:transcriptional regulator with XRE-family HTH domain